MALTRDCLCADVRYAGYVWWEQELGWHVKTRNFVCDTRQGCGNKAVQVGLGILAKWKTVKTKSRGTLHLYIFPRVTQTEIRTQTQCHPHTQPASPQLPQHIYMFILRSNLQGACTQYSYVVQTLTMCRAKAIVHSYVHSILSPSLGGMFNIPEIT